MTEKASFDNVSNDFLLPKIEEEIIDYWDKNNIFSKTLLDRKESQIFTFYEGPPTANGTPGIHHVLARVIKDLILRYKIGIIETRPTTLASNLCAYSQ